MVVDGREVFAVEMAFILFPLSHSSTTTDAESASIFSTFFFSAPAAGRRMGRHADGSANTSKNESMNASPLPFNFKFKTREQIIELSLERQRRALALDAVPFMGTLSQVILI